MKEWLKVFADAYDVYPLKLKYHKTSISFDQFITDFLHDNPLPLPTYEEAGEAAISLTDGLSPFESFIAGVEFCREKMEGK